MTANVQIMIAISQKRFDALAGYTRLPAIVLIVQEAGWFATDDERLLVRTPGIKGATDRPVAPD